MTIILGYSQQSAPSAARIAEASDGKIVAVRSDACDVNWGRRRASGLNPDISNAVNKRIMRELFAEHDVPSPRVFTPDEAKAVIVSGDIRLVGRPDRHTRRRGFWLCETLADIDRALTGTRRKQAATHFIEFIECEREFRAHVFRGRSIRISEKLFDPETPRKYTTIKPTLSRRRHVRRAAKDAVAALGLDFGAVDLLADDDQVWVLEVNVAPGLGGSLPRLWAETIINWKEQP